MPDYIPDTATMARLRAEGDEHLTLLAVKDFLTYLPEQARNRLRRDEVVVVKTPDYRIRIEKRDALS